MSDIKGPLFHLNSFREHLLNMKQGLRFMGGDIVDGKGRPLSHYGVLKIVNHVYENLPADKRIWGFHLDDAMEALRRNPPIFEEEDYESPPTG